MGIFVTEFVSVLVLLRAQAKICFFLSDIDFHLFILEYTFVGFSVLLCCLKLITNSVVTKITVDIGKYIGVQNK